MAISDQEFVNDRIAELMAEEPVNEMQASSPDVFQKQEQAIESFLGGIGQFADEKNIRFLKQMANPQYTRDVAETMSFGADMTPVLGDIQAIREGSRMMGDDQPLMGGALMAASIFTTMPPAKIKRALTRLWDKIDNDVPERIHNANNLMRSDRISDRRQGARWMKKVKEDEKRYLKDIEDAREALQKNWDYTGPTAVPPLTKTGKEKDFFTKQFLDDNPDFKKMLVKGRKEEVGLKLVPEQVSDENLKGIVNANAETRKTYQEILNKKGPSNISDPISAEQKRVRIESQNQIREINKGIKEADLEDRNEIIRFLAQLKDKKPK